MQFRYFDFPHERIKIFLMRTSCVLLSAMQIKRRPGHMTMNIYYLDMYAITAFFNSIIASKAQPGNEIR